MASGGELKMYAFTDGLTKHGEIGMAVVFGNGYVIRRKQKGRDNLLAELLACLYALEYFQEKEIKDNCILTDNMFVFNIRENSTKKEYIERFGNLLTRINLLLQVTNSVMTLIEGKVNKADIESRFVLWGDGDWLEELKWKPK